MRRFKMDKIVYQSCYIGREGDGKTCAICDVAIEYWLFAFDIANIEKRAPPVV